MKPKKKIDRSGFIGYLEGYLTEEAIDYLTDPKRDKELEQDFLNSIHADEGVE